MMRMPIIVNSSVTILVAFKCMNKSEKKTSRRLLLLLSNLQMTPKVCNYVDKGDHGNIDVYGIATIAV